MKITVVRHTRVACGPEICYGQTDMDVAPSFEEEAEKVKTALRDHQYDYVVSSPLKRCTKLAAYCGYQNVNTDKRLMELNFGDWEGLKWTEIDDANSRVWYEDWINTPATNGESFADQVKRVDDFLKELQTTNHKNVLVFAHAGIIRSFAILFGHIKINLAFSDYKVEYGDIKVYETTI